MGTVTGKSAKIGIYSGATHYKPHSVWGISDFSLTFDRGTVEQELVGESGNWFGYGALSCEGSYTNCKFGASGNSDALDSIILGSKLIVSGNTGASLSWLLTQCQVTSYGVSVGDADTISEASIDFVCMTPYNLRINKSTGHITDGG